MKPVEPREFFCRHDDDSSARCDEVLDAGMAVARGQFADTFVDERPVEAMIWALGGVKIYTDQWGAVADPLDEDVWIQFDDLADGLAALLVYRKQKEADTSERVEAPMEDGKT